MQLNHHRAFVERFIKPWLELIKNLHRDADDGSAEFLVKYLAHGRKPDSNRGLRGLHG
jgi:hypothetical protein